MGLRRERAAQRGLLCLALSLLGVEILDSSCLHEQFERQVASSPEAVALTFEGAHLTYAELNGRANQLASYLRECGVCVETRVGLCLDRGFDTVVSQK